MKEIVNKDIGDGDDKQQFGSQNKKGRERENIVQF
jgi:hypothetical protein